MDRVQHGLGVSESPSGVAQKSKITRILLTYNLLSQVGPDTPSSFRWPESTPWHSRALALAMDEVIEISSSPEPLPRSSRDVQVSFKFPKQRKRARNPVVNEDEIIELTDSEDDIPVNRDPLRSTSKISTMESRREPRSQAGPSRPATKPFGTPRKNTVSDAHTQGGQSAASVERLISPGSDNKLQAVPLFLPEDNDDQLPRLQTPHSTSVIVDPISEDLLEPILKPDSPPPDIDPMDTYVARVLEIIPDVQPTHVLSLLEQNVEAHQDGVVEVVLHAIFEDPNYPKIDKKGKRKREEREEEESSRHVKSKVKIDYGNKDRANQGGPLYAEIALVWVSFC
jgi:E3 ubiquitin-protein ligase RNF216